MLRNHDSPDRQQIGAHPAQVHPVERCNAVVLVGPNGAFGIEPAHGRTMSRQSKLPAEGPKRHHADAARKPVPLAQVDLVKVGDRRSVPKVGDRRAR